MTARKISKLKMSKSGKNIGFCKKAHAELCGWGWGGGVKRAGHMQNLFCGGRGCEGTKNSIIFLNEPGKLFNVVKSD